MADLENSGKKSAPYVSWRSVGTVMQDLRAHGVPSRVDRSVLGRFAGSVATQLMAALRFLELTDREGVPRPAFGQFVAEYGTEAGKEALSLLLRKAYVPLFELDLATTTAAHFHETFRRHYSGADAVLAKSEAFFLQAAQDAGIPISPRLLRGKRGRPNGGSPSRKRTSRKMSDSVSDITPPPVPAGTDKITATNEFQLVALLAPDMEDKEREAVWTLIQYLKTKGAKKASS